MDNYLNTIKARVKLSLQNEVNQTQTILGEAFYKKINWKGEKNSYIQRIVVKNGNIFYQIQGNTAIFKTSDQDQSITPVEFYEPFLQNTKLSYPEPQFLTLGETVVKTEQPYEHFIVAEHFTKKIYFIAHRDQYGNDGSLYAADIGKGGKEVVAEKVETGKVGNTNVLTALAVDQISGDIVLARCTSRYRSPCNIHIQSWQKLAHLSEWLTFAEISSPNENEQEA